MNNELKEGVRLIAMLVLIGMATGASVWLESRVDPILSVGLVSVPFGIGVYFLWPHKTRSRVYDHRINSSKAPVERSSYRYSVLKINGAIIICGAVLLAIIDCAMAKTIEELLMGILIGMGGAFGGAMMVWRGLGSSTRSRSGHDKSRTL